MFFNKKDKPPKPKLVPGNRNFYQIVSGNNTWMLLSGSMESAIGLWIGNIEDPSYFERIFGILRVGEPIDNLVFLDTKVMLQYYTKSGAEQFRSKS